MTAIEKLHQATERNKSLLCVGLDVDISKFPDGISRDMDGIVEFNRQIIEATSDLVNSYKLNFAFYEQYGIEGLEAMKRSIQLIPNNILIIGDAKRGDIGNTSKAYAKAVFETFGCDAITVAPYMGKDSVLPFLEYKDKLTFVLCLTSNPGSEDFEKQNIGDQTLYELVMKRSLEWGSENIGFVTGATHPSEIEKLRRINDKVPFLIPGIGAQGGDLKATLKANGNSPACINASRAVIYASSESNFAEVARKVAENYVAEMK